RRLRAATRGLRDPGYAARRAHLSGAVPRLPRRSPRARPRACLSDLRAPGRATARAESTAVARLAALLRSPRRAGDARRLGLEGGPARRPRVRAVDARVARPRLGGAGRPAAPPPRVPARHPGALA